MPQPKRTLPETKILKWQHFVFFFLFVIAATAPFFSVQKAHAQAVTLSDYRVLFNERTRAHRLMVSNRSDMAQRYVLEMAEYYQDEKGKMHRVEAQQARWPLASPMIRYSPRQELLLQPGETQQVRLALRKPADLPAGEYRSHLRFRSLGGVEKGPSKGFKLEPRVSMSIPVVVRHQTTPAKAAILGVRMAPPKDGRGPLAFVDIGRQGQESLYGAVAITDTASGERLGQATGVSIYTTTRGRPVPVLLEGPGPFVGRSVTISFMDSDRKQIVANGTLTIQR